MKLLVIGLGQCGGRIADRFARLNKRGHALRGMDTLAGVFAVNTDVTDLSGLRTIKPDYKHRILIGAQRKGKPIDFHRISFMNIHRYLAENKGDIAIWTEEDMENQLGRAPSSKRRAFS